MTMQSYLNVFKHILEEGVQKGDRTGTGTISTFGEHQFIHDLSTGFPLPTTKFVSIHDVKVELIWFIRGLTNIKFLLENKVNIWNEWGIKIWFESEWYKAIHCGPDMTDFGRRRLVDPEFNELYKIELAYYKEKILTSKHFSDQFGDLGPVYGRQWRDWITEDGTHIDQLAEVIELIKTNPDSRREIVTAWNPGEVKNMALPPCHCFFQFYVANGKLSLKLTQRSCDAFLGLAYNIPSYALLCHIVAQVCGLEVGKLIISFGDLHIYSNHMEQVALQMTREPFALPTLKLNPDIKNIDDFEIDDIQLEGYVSHPKIKAPIAV
jgi:thymidylate synthase